MLTQEKCRILFAALLCAVMLVSMSAGPDLCVRAAAESGVTVSVVGGMAVYSISGESYVRASDGNPSRLSSNEFISFYVDVKNTGTKEARYRTAYFRVDGGEKWIWANFSLKAGETKRCHIYHVNMQKLNPGSHEVDFYVNDQLVYSQSFYTSRNWRSKMTYPTAKQIEAASRGGRSPYVVYYPHFSGADIITEYAIDFVIDEMEKGTYFSTLDADMDTSALQKKYKKIYNDFNSVGGFYCGFQQWDNGKTAVIMSVWDVICEDSRGNTSIICAKQLYPEIKEGISRTSGEGRFQQFIREYTWYPRHPYRMLMQHSVSKKSGNAELTMWICDLVNMEWTELVSWDLGYVSRGIKTNSLGGFMENYLTQFAGNVRNVSFFNIRGRNSVNGKWLAAKSVTFTVNNSVSKLNYNGSYNFGADDASFWIITSGVSGLCNAPQSGKTFSIKRATTDWPY